MVEYNTATSTDMEQFRISNSTIETDSLSTCLGVLIDGSINNKPFCFLSHSSQVDEVEDDDSIDLLTYLLENLVAKLKRTLGIVSLSSPFENNSVGNLKLLVVGGAIGKFEQTRKAYSLLNDNISITAIQDYTNNADAIYLFEQLKNKVKVILPITYVDSDEDEQKGVNGERVFFPPAVALEYNCNNKRAVLFIQWPSSIGFVNVALMYVKDFESDDIEQYKWHWQQQQIDILNNIFAIDPIELNAFKKMIEFLYTTITSYGLVSLSESPTGVNFKMPGYFVNSFIFIDYIPYGFFERMYKVRSREDHRLYVIKTLSLQFYDKEFYNKRLKQIQVHQLLSQHKHIVNLINSWEDFDSLYIQTEFYKTNLFEYAKDHQITQIMIYFYLDQISRAVDYIHSLSYAHMDIKSKNIFLTFDGILKLSSCNMGHQFNNISTATSGIKQLKAYEDEICKSIDIFSIGVIPFEFNIQIDEQLKRLLYEMVNPFYKERPSAADIINNNLIQTKVFNQSSPFL